jgi:hypothetical protein
MTGHRLIVMVDAPIVVPVATARRGLGGWFRLGLKDPP